MARVVTTVVLVATVGGALLPNGLLPKIAGPCGRELCYCENLPVLPPHCKASQNTRNELPVPQVLTLGGQAVSAADAPGVAFELATSTAELQPTAVFAFPIFEAAPRPPLDQHFGVISHIDDVAVPPPRA